MLAPRRHEQARGPTYPLRHMLPGGVEPARRDLTQLEQPRVPRCPVVVRTGQVNPALGVLGADTCRVAEVVAQPVRPPHRRITPTNPGAPPVAAAAQDLGRV